QSDDIPAQEREIADVDALPGAGTRGGEVGENRVEGVDVDVQRGRCRVAEPFGEFGQEQQAGVLQGARPRERLVGEYTGRVVRERALGTHLEVETDVVLQHAG